MGRKFEEGVYEIFKKYNFFVVMNRVGGMFIVFFIDLKEVKIYDDVKICNVERFNRYFEYMLKSGINLVLL